MKLTIFCRWSTILREMTMHKKVIFAVWRCKTGLLFAITFLANTNIRTVEHFRKVSLCHLIRCIYWINLHFINDNKQWKSFVLRFAVIRCAKFTLITEAKVKIYTVNALFAFHSFRWIFYRTKFSANKMGISESGRYVDAYCHVCEIIWRVVAVVLYGPSFYIYWNLWQWASKLDWNRNSREFSGYNVYGA